MLPGVSGAELLILAAVALVVVGPKDLPMLMRKVGQMINKARGLAADFRTSFDDMARQAELDDLRKEVEALRQTKVTDVVGDLDLGVQDVAREIEADLHGATQDLPSLIERDMTNVPPPAPVYSIESSAAPTEAIDLATVEAPPLEDPAPYAAPGSEAAAAAKPAKPRKPRAAKAVAKA